MIIIIDNNIIVKINADSYYLLFNSISCINLPNSRRLYIFITDGEVLLFVEEDNLSNDLRPIDGREEFGDF
jgi:hypothetical protein